MRASVSPIGSEAAARLARAVPLTRRYKAAYGAGAMADGIVSAGFGFFLLFYLTAVCGMSGTMAGTAKLIALLVDAVADPAIGLASDRIRSRFGRRLPFMVGGLVPFRLCLWTPVFDSAVADRCPAVSLCHRLSHRVACLDILLRTSIHGRRSGSHR